LGGFIRDLHAEISCKIVGCCVPFEIQVLVLAFCVTNYSGGCVFLLEKMN